jgi:carbon storage regulator CsrA
MSAAPKLGRLVISRRLGESVRIGDVVVEVVRMHRAEVRLAITAPSDMPIIRTELEQER